MRNAHKYIFSTLLLSTTACSTLNESVQLGATLGAASGVAAIHAGHGNTGQSPDSQAVMTGAVIGMAVGILTSYITFKEVEERRYTPIDGPDTYFGDLPPNPFIIPKTHRKAGR